MIEEKKSIHGVYHPKGSDTVGIEISKLTNKKVDKSTEEIGISGSSCINDKPKDAGVIANLSDEEYVGEGRNYWILDTDHARQLGIGRGMKGTVVLLKDGRIWTKPIEKVKITEIWEDMDSENVSKNLEETEDKYSYDVSNNKRKIKIKKVAGLLDKKD